MEAGRELDALVAEQVMGLRYVQGPHPTIPRYSTDIAAAWHVVDKMGWSYCYFELGHQPFDAFSDGEGGDYPVSSYWYCSAEQEYRAEGASPPHAICLAALKAVGVDV